MINILAKNWQFIITIFPAMFVLYKFYLQRMDTRIERKTKDLETIDTIITNLPSEFLEVKNNLSILSTTEKLNAFFKTKFEEFFYLFSACSSLSLIRTRGIVTS